MKNLLDADGLWAISPLDGRYRGKLAPLADCVSEAALIGYRIRVEAAWLLHLAEEPQVKLCFPAPPPLLAELARLAALEDIGPAAARVKVLEKSTNHDVKAVEYYLRECLTAVGADAKCLAFIHFACTSEDINNLAYGLMLSDLRTQFLLPAMDHIDADLTRLITQHADLAMLARTHGQTATPTTLGKELTVFAHRLARCREALCQQPIFGKMSGAVGNYNAQMVAFPEVDWEAVAQRFIEGRLNLKQNPWTTQIESHDGLVEYFDCVRRYNTVLLGLTRDFWSYISLGYFKQAVIKNEVGSSTMPHKVNPIDFENAEGNLGLANALAHHFADKLPISRWQRDLSDSTVQRSLGALAGYSLLAYQSTRQGLAKVTTDAQRIAADLDGAWEVLGEAVQTVLRRYGVVDAYERLKAATRGTSISREILHGLIDQSTELPPAVRAKLKALTPKDYVGKAASLARNWAALER